LQLANASSPAAQAIVGASMAADIARAIDRAWLASSTPKASDGLGSLTGSGAVEIDVDGVYENVDCFSDAISEAEAVEATITAFCADASTVKALRKLKTFSGSTESNEPLLQGQARDATTGFRSRILGVPIYSLPSGTIELGTIWPTTAAACLSFCAKTSYSRSTARSSSMSSHLQCALGFVSASVLARTPQSVVRITGDLPGGS
jgi:hypothetical protein